MGVYNKWTVQEAGTPRKANKRKRLCKTCKKRLNMYSKGNLCEACKVRYKELIANFMQTPTEKEIEILRNQTRIGDD